MLPLSSMKHSMSDVNKNDIGKKDEPEATEQERTVYSGINGLSVCGCCLDLKMGRCVRYCFWGIISFSLMFYVSLYFSEDFWNNINLDGTSFVNIIPSSGNKGLRRLLEEGQSPGSEKRLPRCVIVGVRKCGTRALLEFLSLHSQIKAAHTEIHFFDVDEKYSKGLEWYRKMMPYSYQDDITIEKSPRYFITAKAPQRIHDMNSSIKLIFILRHPTQRVISDYAQVTENKQTKNMSYERFEDLVIDKKTGLISKDYKAVAISMYYQYFQRWHRYFPKDQIHVVDGDQLVVDPVSEIRQVETFLNLSHEVTYNNLYFNESRGFYCMKTEKGDQCLGKGKGRKHPKVNSDVVKKLNTFFHPYNEKLFQMIGKRFHWT